MMIPTTRPILPAGRLPERRQVGAVDQVDPEEDEDRQRGQDPARHAALSGKRAGEPAQLLARADVVGHLVDHLGGVAACVALQERDESDLLEVAALHARHARAERVLERYAEPLVGDDAGQLLVRRLRGAVGDDRERAGKAVARAERLGEHVEVVGELVAERASASARPST